MAESSKLIISPDIVDRCANELATKSNLSVEDAKKVLTTLGLDKLVEGANNRIKILADKQNAEIIGINEDDLKKIKKILDPSYFKIENLRLTLDGTTGSDDPIFIRM